MLYFVTEGYMDINKLVRCKVERNRMLQVLAFVVQYGSLWFWYFQLFCCIAEVCVENISELHLALTSLLDLWPLFAYCLCRVFPALGCLKHLKKEDPSSVDQCSNDKC